MLVVALLMQPRMYLAFWYMSTHSWLMLSFLSTNTHKSFLPGWHFICFLPSLCLCLGFPWLRRSTLYVALVNKSLNSVKVLLDGRAALWCWPHQTALGHQQTCWGCTEPHCPCCNKDVKKCWCQYRPLKNHQLDIEKSMKTLQTCSFIQFFYPLSGPSVKSMSLQFRNEVDTQNTVK